MPFQVELDAIFFPESPRWHGGALWISDIIGQRVLRHTPGRRGPPQEILVLAEDKPSGLGWLPDGTLLVVAMEGRRVLRVEGDGSITTHADLARLAHGMTNDMVVHDDGLAYVSDGGFQGFASDEPRRPGQVLAVRPDGGAFVAADHLEAPNGLAITPDGRTLVVAESHASRLTMFTIAADGTLRDARTFAKLEPARPERPVAPPDGICLDAEGLVWATDLVGRRLVRVAEGGAIAEVLTLPELTPVACMLGGDRRRTLFVCASHAFDASIVHQAAPTNKVLAIEVAVPGAGWP